MKAETTLVRRVQAWGGEFSLFVTPGGSTWLLSKDNKCQDVAMLSAGQLVELVRAIGSVPPEMDICDEERELVGLPPDPDEDKSEAEGETESENAAE
jgi:hypothetical protein